MTKIIKTMESDPYEVRPETAELRPASQLSARGTSPKREAGKKPEKNERFYLCRCGRSKNMPFCDDTHKRPIGLQEKTYGSTLPTVHQNDAAHFYEEAELT